MSTDTTSQALADLQADNQRLASELASLKTERDTLKTAAAQVPDLQSKLQQATGSLQTLTAERDTFKSKVGELEGSVTKMTNTSRERDFLDALAAEAPQVDRKVLRGMVVDAAEKGALERYPEKPVEAAKAAIEKFKAEAPAVFAGKGNTAGGAPSSDGQQQKRRHVL